MIPHSELLSHTNGVAHFSSAIHLLPIRVAVETRSNEETFMISNKIVYEKIRTIIPELLQHIEEGKQYGKSEVEGYLDLHFNYERQERNGNHIIRLSHYSEIAGKEIPETIMEIRIIPNRGRAEAYSLENQFGHYQVYEHGYANESNKRRLNAFLDTWLSDLMKLGHRINLCDKPLCKLPDFEEEEKSTCKKSDKEPEQGIER